MTPGHSFAAARLAAAAAAGPVPSNSACNAGPSQLTCRRTLRRLHVISSPRMGRVPIEPYPLGSAFPSHCLAPPPKPKRRGRTARRGSSIVLTTHGGSSAGMETVTQAMALTFPTPHSTATWGKCLLLSCRLSSLSPTAG